MINGVSEIPNVTTNQGSFTNDYLKTTTTEVTIGNRLEDDRFRMIGRLADLRVYSDILTSTEVNDLYAGTDVTGNLEGHWLKNTDDILDHSGNGYDGEEVFFVDFNQGDGPLA